MGIDVDIKLPLNALRDIPVGFTVPRKVDDLPSQSLTSITHKLILHNLTATGKTKKIPKSRSTFRDFVFSASVLDDRDVRRIDRLHANHMIAAVGVMNFTRNRT